MKKYFLLTVIACIIFLVFVPKIIPDVNNDNTAIIITGIIMFISVVGYSILQVKEKKKK